MSCSTYRDAHVPADESEPVFWFEQYCCERAELPVIARASSEMYLTAPEPLPVLFDSMVNIVKLCGRA